MNSGHHFQCKFILFGGTPWWWMRVNPPESTTVKILWDDDLAKKVEGASQWYSNLLIALIIGIFSIGLSYGISMNCQFLYYYYVPSGYGKWMNMARLVRWFMIIYHDVPLKSIKHGDFPVRYVKLQEGNWWLIPLTKQAINLIINGISRLNQVVTGVIIRLLCGMKHKVIGMHTQVVGDDHCLPSQVATSWGLREIHPAASQLCDCRLGAGACCGKHRRQSTTKIVRECKACKEHFSIFFPPVR